MATESGDSRHGGYGHECWDGCEMMATEPCPECGYESGHRESCPGYYNDSPTDDKPDDKPTPRCNRCRGNPHIGACHDKPPDRAEWEILLLELIEIADDDDACDIEVVEAEKQLRVAVQRALDEREEPEPGQLIAKITCPSCGVPVTIEHGDDENEVVALATSKTRARRNDGDRIRR